MFFFLFERNERTEAGYIDVIIALLATLACNWDIDGDT